MTILAQTLGGGGASIPSTGPKVKGKYNSAFQVMAAPQDKQLLGLRCPPPPPNHHHQQQHHHHHHCAFIFPFFIFKSKLSF